MVFEMHIVCLQTQYENGTNKIISVKYIVIQFHTSPENISKAILLSFIPHEAKLMTDN
jgi:hypothetical protein